MYRCDRCHQQQPPGVPSTLIPTETRRVTYPARPEVHAPLPRPDATARQRRTRRERRPDPGGAGHETVREQRCCPRCAAQAPD